MLKKFGTAISSAFPTIARFVAGPAGPVVEATIETVKSILGVEKNADEEALIEAYKSAPPEVLVRLREIELERARLPLEEQTLILGDRDSARKLAGLQGLRFHFVLTLLITAAFFSLLGVLAYAFLSAVSVNSDVEPILNIAIGALMTAFTSAVAFWFGTTRSSSEKTQHLVNLANGKK